MTGWCSRGSRLWWESPRLVWGELGALLETHRAHVVHCRAYVVRDAHAARCAHAMHTLYTVHTRCSCYAHVMHARRTLCVCVRQLCAWSGFPCVLNIPVSSEGFPSQVFNECSTYN